MNQEFSLNVHGNVRSTDVDLDMCSTRSATTFGLNNPHFGCGLALDRFISTRYRT
jgi:hypothetical protein